MISLAAAGMTQFEDPNMSGKHLIAASLTVFGTLALVHSAQAFTGQEFSKDAKFTMDQATAIALKACPGQVTDKELEKERGGSGLRYSFDIKLGSVTHEVGVDAKTGKVLENSLEGANPD